MTSRLLIAGALLLPAVASAQPVPDPNDPSPPAEQPAPVVTDPPPTVIVNPPPRATVVDVEPSYEVVEDPWNAPVFATGALVFGASYGASVIAAASMSDDNREAWGERLYVPVVGPWLALNDHGDCPIELPACDDETTTKVLLVADGVFQAAGLITMVHGVLSPSYHRRVVRTTSNDKIRVRPTVVGRGGSGLVVFGQW